MLNFLNGSGSNTLSSIGITPKINNGLGVPFGKQLTNTFEKNMRDLLKKGSAQQGIAEAAPKTSGFQAGAANFMGGGLDFATGFMDFANINNSSLNSDQKRMAKADSAVNTISNVASNFGPVGSLIGGGLKALNSIGGSLIKTPKELKDFNINSDVSASSGFTGVAASAQSTLDSANSFKNAGFFGKLFGKKNKLVGQTRTSNTQHNEVNSILEANKKAMARIGNSSLDIMNTNKLYNGSIWNNGSVQFGRQGAKLVKAQSGAKLLLDTSLSDNKSLIKSKIAPRIESQSQWTGDYINSPKYKERLVRQINTEKNIIHNSGRGKFHNPDTMLSGQQTAWSANTVANNKIRHQNEQLNHLNEGNIRVGNFSLGLGVGGEYQADSNKIFIPEGVAASDEGKLVSAHEMSHGINAGRAPYSYKFDSQFLKGRVLKNATDQGYDDYVQNPTEIKARLDALRYQMKQGGYYDAGTQNFDKSTLDKMKADKNITNDVNYKSLKGQLNPKAQDQSLMWLMNNIAKNKTDNTISYAQQGGVIFNPIQSPEIQEVNTDFNVDTKINTGAIRLSELAKQRKELQERNDELKRELSQKEAEEALAVQNAQAEENENSAKVKPVSKNKFENFESRSLEILQTLNPGKRVEVKFENTGVYAPDGSRDWATQADLKAKGASKTSLSLHNFGAAKDYRLVVDGKTIDVGNTKLYKDVLWKAAQETGLHTIGDWDVAHIGLAPEGKGETWNYLKQYHPDIFETERSKDTITKLKAANQEKYLKQLGIFKEGGTLSNKNVIVHGALHARKHSLKDVEEFNDAAITHKGVPVITKDAEGGVLQHSEVEGGEVVLHYECTQKLEALRKEGTDEAAIKAGKLLARELMKNTKDKTGTLRSIKNI